MALVQCPFCETLLDSSLAVCPGCGGCWRCGRKTGADPGERCSTCDLPYCPCCGRCAVCGAVRYSGITPPCDCDPSAPPENHPAIATDEKGQKTWPWPEDHPRSRRGGCGSAALGFLLAALAGVALIV